MYNVHFLVMIQFFVSTAIYVLLKKESPLFPYKRYLSVKMSSSNEKITTVGKWKRISFYHCLRFVQKICLHRFNTRYICLAFVSILVLVINLFLLSPFPFLSDLPEEMLILYCRSLSFRSLDYILHG